MPEQGVRNVHANKSPTLQSEIASEPGPGGMEKFLVHYDLAGRAFRRTGFYGQPTL